MKTLARQRQDSAHRGGVMMCPKCIFPMVNVKFSGIEVARCTDCQGLFVDERAKQQLRRLKGAETLDVGDPNTGREFNQVDLIDCPRCGRRMIRMVDHEHSPISFEHCSVCGGSFFDAGEFKELTLHSSVDFFSDLLVQAIK